MVRPIFTLLALSSLAACGGTKPAPVVATTTAPSTATTGTPATAAASTPADATPRVVARSLGGVFSFAADDTFAYIAKKGGDVVRVPLAGGEPKKLGAVPEGNDVMAMTASPEGIYLVVASGGESAIKNKTFGQGAVLLVPLEGGAPVQLASGFGMPISIVLDENKIYWTAEKPGKKPIWSLFSAPRKIGKPMVAKPLVVNQMSRVFATTKTSVLVAGLLGGVAVQPFAEAEKPGAPLGSLLQVDAAALVEGGRVVIAGTQLDVEHDGKAIPTVTLGSLAGGAFSTLATHDAEDHLGGLVSVGNRVYYTLIGTTAGRYHDGKLVRISLDDKTVTVIAKDQFQPAKVVATSSGIVWLNERGHFVGGEGDGELVLAPLK